MKKLSVILASLVLFTGMTFAGPVKHVAKRGVRQEKAKTEKKEEKKAEKKEAKKAEKKEEKKADKKADKK